MHAFDQGSHRFAAQLMLHTPDAPVLSSQDVDKSHLALHPDCKVLDEL